MPGSCILERSDANFKCLVKHVLKVFTPDARSSFPRSCGVSSLHHKVLDVPTTQHVIFNSKNSTTLYVPVKEAVIVVATSTESQEVLQNKLTAS